MIRNIRRALILGAAVTTTLMTFAQSAPNLAPATQQATATPDQTPASVIPLDQQPSKEQLAKLFEVMRVNQQLASVTKMMPENTN